MYWNYYYYLYLYKDYYVYILKIIIIIFFFYLFAFILSGYVSLFYTFSQLHHVAVQLLWLLCVCCSELPTISFFKKLFCAWVCPVCVCVRVCNKWHTDISVTSDYQIILKACHKYYVSDFLNILKNAFNKTYIIMPFRNKANYTMTIRPKKQALIKMQKVMLSIWSSVSISLFTPIVLFSGNSQTLRIPVFG